MKLFKRSLSVLLAGLMAISQPMATLADTESVEPTYVGGERLEDVPEEGNYVYFGNTAITLREGNGSFSVPIYRVGDDTSEKAWVKIHTIDLTSVYGRDYRVKGKHKTEHAGKKNIFQLLAEEDSSDSTEVKTYEFDLENTATPSEAKKSDSAENDADKQASAQSDDVKSESDKTDAKNETSKTDAEASKDNDAEVEALDDGYAAEDDIIGYDDDFAVGGLDDELVLDEAYAADGDEIDINDDSLEVKNIKEVSSDSISNAELAARYNEESAAILNKTDDSTSKSADADNSSVIIAPKRATATEFLDDSEAAQAELIDQKAVVDADTYDSDSDEDDGISELAKLKYEQTGVPSREGTPTGTVNANITDQIFGAIAPEYMGLISYSCEQTIYFEPGEEEAEFTFELYDNIKTDGSRMFSVIITETSDNVEPYKVTNMSVLIEDDEETAHSKIGFASDSFDGKDNSAEIKVVRSDLLQTMATAVLTAENSDTGEVETLGEIVFTPYEKEKTIKLNISHDSILKLTDLTAADEGDIMSAIVTGTDNMTGEYGIEVASENDNEEPAADVDAKTDEAMALSDDEAVALAADNSSASSGSSEEKEFTINVNGKSLTGTYKNGDIKATLYDKSYDPVLAVGDYFFAIDDKNGGIFSYDPLHLEGDQPGWGGEAAEAFVFESDEAKANKDFRKSHGWAHYFTRGKGQLEGRVRIDPVLDKASPINALYYQYVAPEMEMGETWATIWSDEWTSFRIGPKSFYTNGQPKDQVEKYVHHMIGKFGRGVQPALAVRITNENSLLYPMASAEDNCTFVCKTMFNIWGMAAMYKMYEISVEDAEPRNYKSADGKTTTVPYQVKIKAGAVNKNKSNEVRDMYVNPASENSNVVFTVQANNINGSTGTFGKLAGYRITIGNGKSKTDKTVEYPKDFIAYLKDSKRVSTDAIDYGADAVEKEVAKINNDIAIVPVDIYFVDWMNSVSSEYVVPSSNMNNTAHYQMLKFKPVVDYIDVNVQITEPNIAGKGLTSNIAHFKDSELKAGTTKTYHAGDMLDLTAIADNSLYTVVGYEVSTDGGVKFNHIEDSTQLVLQAGSVKDYIIRPEVAVNDNYIEVDYASGVNGYVHVDNLVPQEELKNYPELKGKNILDINPQAKNIYDRIFPTVGKAYSIDVIVDTAVKGGNTVRPTVTDGDNGKTYTTNKYYFIARNSRNNNKFKVGVKFSNTGNVHDYTLTGSVTTKALSVRQDGKGYNTLPTKGYTIFAGSGQAKVTSKTTKEEVPVVNISSSTIDDSGAFTIQGKSGESGDLITVLCSNGLSDDQVIEVKLGINKDKNGKYTDNAGQLVMGYPITAPEIKTVTYSYDKESSSQGVTLNESQIRLLDDNLKLTAVVDNKGHNIESVRFIVRDASGATKELTAKPQDGKSSNVFEVTVKNMLNYFHTGDKIYAYIVDKDSIDINYGTTTKKQQIVYPQIDTGLTTYVQNDKITPKTYSDENNVKGVMKDFANLPVIGGPASGTQSGLITFNKNWHEGHKSYSYTANIDAVYDNVVESAQSKAKRTSGAANSLHEAYKQRKEKLQNRANKEAEIEQKKQDRQDAIDSGNTQNTDKDHMPVDDNVALDIFYNGDSASEISGLDLQDENVANNAADQAPDAKAKEYLTEGYPRYSVNVYLCLDFEFVLDEQNNDYVLSMWSVVIGGKYTIDQVYYNFIMFIPVYIDLTGMIQLNFYFGAVTNTFKEAAKAGDFDNYTGNLKDMANGASVIGGTDAVFIGRFQVGAGVANVLGVRGGISLTFQFQFAQLGGANKDWAGAVLGVSGSIGIDLLVTQFNWTFGTAQKGWGTLSDRTKVAWLLPSDEKQRTSRSEQIDPTTSDTDVQKAQVRDSSKAANEAEVNIASYSLDDESELMEAANGGYYTVSPLGLGSSLDEEGEEGFANAIVESSGGLFRSTPAMDTKEVMQTLKVNAAERTRPQLITIDEKNGKYLLLFIGMGEDSNTARLYYTVYDGANWTDPKVVDETSRYYDSSADVIDMGDGKFMAAWLSAREAIDTSSSTDDFKKAYTSFDIKGAIIDFKNKDCDKASFGKAFTFSSDEKAYGSAETKHYFNTAPQLTKSGRKIICTYLKRDISKAENIQQLTDLTKTYSAVAYVTYDTDALDGEELSKERIFSQHWEGKASDPYITNYAAEGFTGTSEDGLTESDYVAVAYTIDGDSDLESSDDRNMYLSIFNLTDKIVYYPIKLTSDVKTQTMLQMNTLNRNVYLTWLEQGAEDSEGNSDRSDQRFSIMNISDVINAFLQTGGISEKYFYPDGKATPTEAGKATSSNYEALTLFGLRDSTDVATMSEYRVATKSEYKVATPSEHKEEAAAALSTATEKSAVSDQVLLSAMKASVSSLSVAYASQGDPYNSSGWKELDDGWKISGDDWYKLSADDMKADVINYLLSKHSSDEQIGWKDKDKTQAAYYDRAYAESVYDEAFKDTVVGRAQNYNLPKYTTILADNTGRYSASVNEYKLVADGDDIYVFYNDFCSDVTHMGQELYAMRFSENSASKFDKSKEDWNGEAAGFSEPVMLTDENKIIDEFDIQPGPTKGADKGTIKVVSNYYDQTTGKNNLVYFSFSRKGSVKPVASSIDIDEHIVKGSKTEIQFAIKNEGLYTAEGCTVELELLDKNGKTLEKIKVPDDVKKYLKSLKLEPSASVDVTIPWTPDRDLEDTQLKVSAVEESESILNFTKMRYSTTLAVPYKPVIEINDYELSYADGQITVTATVANHGNQDVNELNIVLTRLGLDYDKDVKIDTKALGGGLKSGEEKEISFVYTPKVDDFDGFERIKLELSAVSGEEELESDTTVFTESVPVICEINNGIKEISIHARQSKQLEFKAAPYNDLAGDAAFSSSDPTVAYVDANGVLHALKQGKVTITLYYPSLGISTSVDVTVGESEKARNSDRYKDGTGTGTITVGAGIPGSAVYGQWTFHPETGKWTFAAGSRQYKNEWAYIYNPYAAALQDQSAWFRFDADGNMVTGWFTDTDGSTYYLWPYSDNTMGHMVTGWMPIGTGWYFFNPVSNGTKGAMYRNTTTPDGYRVGEDGAWIRGLIPVNQP